VHVDAAAQRLTLWLFGHKSHHRAYAHSPLASACTLWQFVRNTGSSQPFRRLGASCRSDPGPRFIALETPQRDPATGAWHP
jgi:hypothetical protein